MKKIIFILLGTLIANCISAQGLTKNGQATSTPANYVNRNGGIGITGVNKNGAVIGSANGLSFDGTDDYVSLPPAVYFNGNFTIECWVYPRSFGDWARVIDFGNGAGSNNVLFAYTYGTSGSPGFYVEGAQFMANQTLALNQWSHIAATLNGTTATIYINGVAAGTAVFSTAPANITRNNCYIGKSNWGGDPNANAVFDELRIWNTAKTQVEIQNAMNAGFAGNESGLLAYYNFNQGVADSNNAGLTTLTDKTSNAYNGTLNNFTLSGTTSNWVAGKP